MAFVAVWLGIASQEVLYSGTQAGTVSSQMLGRVHFDQTGLVHATSDLTRNLVSTIQPDMICGYDGGRDIQQNICHHVGNAGCMTAALFGRIVIDYDRWFSRLLA